MDLGMQDRVCVVTGSTGGIGLETARILVEEDAHVVTCGRSQAPRVGEALHVSADLSEPAAPQSVIDAAREALGPVDVLVNNVGTAYIARFDDLTDPQWDAMWQLNVMSYVRAIRAVRLGMFEPRRGCPRHRAQTAGNG